MKRKITSLNYLVYQNNKRIKSINDIKNVKSGTLTIIPDNCYTCKQYSWLWYLLEITNYNRLNLKSDKIKMNKIHYTNIKPNFFIAANNNFINMIGVESYTSETISKNIPKERLEVLKRTQFLFFTTIISFFVVLLFLISLKIFFNVALYF